MIRFISAFAAVVLASLACMAYLFAFDDQFQWNQPFVTLCRHWMTWAIVVSTTWPTVAYWVYRAFGGPLEIAISNSACRRLFVLHFASGALILFGLLLAVANRQPVDLREVIMAVIGLGCVAAAFWERSLAETTAARARSDVTRVNAS